jgi:hypothetical protein
MFTEIPHTETENNYFTTIDIFCLKNKINHIHFLKIDVEGHELAVLKGAAKMLENKQIDVIQFEFGAGNSFSKTFFLDFFKLLSPAYSIYRLLSDGFVPIHKYEADLELLILTYFVAVKKEISRDIISTTYV